METPAIELRNITKRFGSIVANKDINLVVNKGEILSLLGEISSLLIYSAQPKTLCSVLKRTSSTSKNPPSR